MINTIISKAIQNKYSKFWLLAVFMACITPAFGQATPTFPNTQTLIQGTANQPGAVYLVENVDIDVNGTTTDVDALLRIVSFTGTPTVQAVDDTNAVQNRFEPMIDYDTAGEAVRFQIEFIIANSADAANGGVSAAVPFPLDNFTVEIIDVDAQEWIEVLVPDSYELAGTGLPETIITVAPGALPNSTRFTSSDITDTGISVNNTRSIVKINYQNVSVVDFTLGRDSNEPITTRDISLSFLGEVTFTNPNVVSTNSPPVVANKPGNTTQVNQTEIINLLTGASDPDANLDAGSVILLDPNNINNQGSVGSPLVIPGVGTYSVDNAGVLTFTPVSGYLGDATISFRVSDDLGATSNQATAQITVLANEPDNDNDGIPDSVDLDDDNDGILDLVECPAQDSGINGAIPATSVSFDITSSDLNSFTVPHILNSITINGVEYEEYQFPSSFESSYTGIDSDGDARRTVNGVDQSPAYFTDGPAVYDAAIITSFQTNNLNNYQLLSGNDFTNDFYELTYDTPIQSRAGVFAAISERGGNNPSVITAFDDSDNVLGSINVLNANYIDTGARLNAAQNAMLAVFAIDDLAAPGQFIKKLRVDFSNGSTTDSPDGKIFVVGVGLLADCDADGDGISDQFDLDSDNDGITDVIEAGGTDANGDGLADGTVGTTTTTNGIPSSAGTGNTPTDTADGDTIPDYLDIDSDNDGIPDNIEGQTTVAYEEPSGVGLAILDTNSNGVDDNYENGTNIGIVPVNTDATNDTIPDYLDTDSDNDGIPDIQENGSGNTLANADADGDGLDDNFDDNDDSVIDGSTINDGVSPANTITDVASLETSFQDTDNDFNPGSGDLDYRDGEVFIGTDADNDNVPNSTDLDDDNDGILDVDEGSCSTSPIPSANGFSARRIDFVIDPERAVNGVNGQFARFPFPNATLEVTLRDSDAPVTAGTTISIEARTVEIDPGNIMRVTESTDGVNFVNPQDFTFTTANVFSNNSYVLTTNATRLRITYVRQTSRLQVDNVSYASFNEVQCVVRDTDDDGIPDSLDLDSDNDGITDVIESGGTDANGDGLADGTVGTTTTTNGIPSSAGTGNTPTNTADGDTIPDYLDIDSDNDGIPDNIEGQTTVAYEEPSGVGLAILDTNSNGVDDNYENGTNIGIVPVNTDATNDTIPDYLDTDSDNDGIPDIQENGSGNTLANADADGDGLDDNFDDNNDSATSGATVNDGVGASDTITNTSDIVDAYLDTNGNIGAGGDVDFRDNSADDNDGDGIPDRVDLDDDNDGIPDLDESGCTDEAEIRWLHNENSGQSDFATFNPTTASASYTNSSDVSFGAGLDESDNAAFTYTLRGADQTTFAAAKTNNDYAQISFTPAVDLLFQQLNFGFFTLNAAADDFDMGNFKVAVEYATNAGFTSPTVLIEDLQIGDMVAGGFVSFNQPFESFVLNSGTEYFWRIYFYDEQNTDAADRVRLDDLVFVNSVNATCNNDVDGDGIPNSLDLDSDNDGCFDAIESGANPEDVDANGELIGTVDTDNTSSTVGQVTVANTPANTYNGINGNEILPISLTTNDSTIPTTTQNVNVGDNLTVTSNAVATQTDVWNTTAPFAPNYTAAADTPNNIAGATDATSNLVYTWTSLPSTITAPTQTGQSFDFGTITADNAGTYEVTITHSNNACISEVRSFVVALNNQAPVANNDLNNTILEDQDVTINVVANDTDDNGIDASTITLIDPNDATNTGSTGTPLVVPNVGTYTVDALGNVTFDPVGNFNGNANVNYTVQDNDSATPLTSNVATIGITVAAVTDDIADNNESLSTNEDVTLTGDLFANLTDADSTDHSITGATVDANGDGTATPLTLGTATSITDGSEAIGSLTVNADGTFSFVPASNYNGPVPVVNYDLVDDNDATDTDSSTLTITVAAVTDDIADNNESLSTNEDVTL
ncbi:Ig-like domain-containing protein, partial [uncultured Polaribacter sp.]|uniref:Ig-like domain-containing protein n=1 Tax=uncultured Polaribacter sp. TaxID=174711 RepID=UPI002623ACC9